MITRKSLFWIVATFLLFCLLRRSDAAALSSIQGEVRIGSIPSSNAVVYLEPLESSGRAPEPLEKVVRQKNYRFDPSFLVVPLGSTLTFENLDAEIHNVKSDSAGNRFDVSAQSPGELKKVILKKAGVVVLRCRIHHEMRGLVYVSPSPYYTATGEDGMYRITNILPGRYRITIWHPRLTEDEVLAGQHEIEVQPTQTHLDLQLQAKAPVGTDATEGPVLQWTNIADKIQGTMTEAVNRWKDGNSTAAAIRVMTTLSQLYQESGFQKIIEKYFGKARSTEHEMQFDQIRKQVQNVGPMPAAEASLRRDVDQLVNALKAEAQHLDSLSDPR